MKHGSGTGRPLRVLCVSNGFPPSGQWGTEFYTHQLATGLRRLGHEVSVFSPLRDGTQPRYTLERSVRYGVPLFEVHNAGDPKKRFADSYENARVEAIFSELLRELEPDVVHFTHMLWGLSVRLPELARSSGAATVATLTDFGLLCHRGQMLDQRARACEGPRSAAECARCVRGRGPYDGAVERLFSTPLGAGLARLGGLGVVVTARDLELRAARVAESLMALDHVIAPTSAVAENFTRAGLDPTRLTRLCYGIDEEPYRRADRARPEPSGLAPVRFGFLGQFLPHKGLHRLFDAVRLLERSPAERQAARSDWSVRLYGHAVGGRHRRYFDAIWSPDLAQRVERCGAFEPLAAPRVISELDVLVVPSQWTENAPLTVLQARVAGAPVIASDVPGIREVLEPGVHGILVHPDDPRALANAMATFLDVHPTRRASDPPVTHAAHLDRILGIYVRALDEPRSFSAPERVEAATPVARSAQGAAGRLTGAR